MPAKFISIWVGDGDYFHLDFGCPTVMGPCAGLNREHQINMQALAEELARGGFRYCEVGLMADPKLHKGKQFAACPSCVVPGMKKAIYAFLMEVKEKQTKPSLINTGAGIETVSN